MVFIGLNLSFLEFRIGIFRDLENQTGAPWQGDYGVCVLSKGTVFSRYGQGRAEDVGSQEASHSPAGRKVCMLSL